MQSLLDMDALCNLHALHNVRALERSCDWPTGEIICIRLLDLEMHLLDKNKEKLQPR